MVNDGVKLRPLTEDDVPAVHRLLGDMKVIRYMLFPLFDEQAARDFVRESAADSDGQRGPSLVRAIVFADSGILVGLCGLVLDRDRLQGEAWYLLDPDYWGKGLATEAGRHLLAYGFGPLGLHRMWAMCLPQNPASARVLRKLGMRREGYLRKHLRIHGVWRDCFLYAMLREEWHA
jgi:RimJ/RimL family protein N-acetyltransferase